MMPQTTRGSAFACKRCAKHKKKCQPAEGPCSNCTRAGTECSRVKDGVGCRPNGRLLVEPLQRALRHVAEELTTLQTAGISSVAQQKGLERLTTTGEPIAIPDPSIPKPLGEHQQSYVFCTETALRIQRSMSSRVGHGSQSFGYLERLHSGAELPFPLTLRFKGGKFTPRTFQEPPKTSPLLPRNVSERLLQDYIVRILPQCPIISPTEMRSVFHRVYDADAAATKNTIRGDSFILSMTMAITTLAARSEAYRKVVELAEALRTEALHSDNGGEILATTSIRCLQGLLLLTQYGLLMPQAVDLWHTVSEAMRVAVELGLHREPPEAMGLDEETSHNRRRLFWATYSMERAVTLTCHRPFAIRDEQINLKISPATGPSAACLTWGSASAAARYTNHLAYCQLQTEITSVNISSEPIQPPTLTYAGWVLSCEQRIEELRGGNWQEAILIPDWLDLPAWRCLAWLYMPCPRNPRPSEDTIAKFVQALMQILETYWTLVQSKSLKLCWSAVHHAYEVGTQMLYCMQNYPHIVEACYDKISLLDALTHLSDFFTRMEERWSASSQCKLLLEKLRKSIVEAFLQGWTSNTLNEPQSSEQRIVDIIFRKNGYFFFAEEEPFDIQSYLIDSITDSDLNLDLAFDITSTADNLFDCFDLYDETFGASVYGNGNGNGWSSGMMTWESGLVVPSPAASGNSSAGGRTAKLSAKTQGLLKDCTESLENLPVCKFCRAKRVKCSRHLPSCHNCLDFGKDCLYVESFSGELIDGKHLEALRNELFNSLKTLEEAYELAGQLEQVTSRTTSGDRSPRFLLAYETDFGLATFYWGESSILGRLSYSSFPIVNLPANQPTKSLPTSSYQGSEFMLRSVPELPDAFLTSLTERYCRQIEKFLPIVGPKALSELVKSAGPGSGHKQHEQALLNLVVAIALGLPFRERTTMFSTSLHYFDSGVSVATACESLFLSSTIESLQFALLMCVYVWLYPAVGNLSRLVAAACRLCLDLLESQDLSIEETATLHVLFRTTYVLDTDTAVAFGRPNYLPEWKSREKMVVESPAYDEIDSLALLAYNSAKMRSTIHNTIINSTGMNAEVNVFVSSTITTMQAQVEGWWDEWKRETSLSIQNTNSPDVVSGQHHDSVFFYGSLAFFQTIGLLFVLARIHGCQEEVNLNSDYAESVINTHAEILQHSVENRNDGLQEQEFPIFWSHYSDIFGAGLELILSGPSEARDSLKKSSSLQLCLNLLKYFERCIGTPEWELSESLAVLICN